MGRRTEPKMPEYSDVVEALGTIHLHRGGAEVAAEDMEQVYEVLDAVARKIAHDAQARIE